MEPSDPELFAVSQQISKSDVYQSRTPICQSKIHKKASLIIAPSNYAKVDDRESTSQISDAVQYQDLR